MDTMGTRIKTLRKALGLTQTQLGSYVGVTKVAVSLWENDRVDNMPLKTFITLSEALGSDPTYLIYGKQGSEPT